MSTKSYAFSPAGWGRVLSQNLQDLIAALETDSSLCQPKLLRARLDALDELEARFGDCNAKEFMNDADARIHHHARQSGPGSNPPMQKSTNLSAPRL
jgi:hypothetical protein